MYGVTLLRPERSCSVTSSWLQKPKRELVSVFPLALLFWTPATAEKPLGQRQTSIIKNKWGKPALSPQCLQAAFGPNLVQAPQGCSCVAMGASQN